MAAEEDRTSLPLMPIALPDDEPCTEASDRTAKGANWAQKSLSLPHAWQLSQGDGITVGVVDTGVSATAATLRSRVTVVGEAGSDCVGHGTFTAGLIAAAQTSGTDFHGVAPAARIIAVRGTDERGLATADRVAQGIRTAVDRGAQVVHVSSALSVGEEALTAAVRHATERDVLVVAPAAPDSERRSTDARVKAYWPASAPGVLSVAGVTAGGTLLKSAADAPKADLAAPGSAVVGVGPRGSGHFIATGSSAAAAFAAGAAALVRAYDTHLTAAETARRLTSSAAPTGNAPRLDPYAAVSMISTGHRGQAAVPDSEPLRLPVVSTTFQDRALAIAGAMAVMVLVVAAAAVVIPRGRARGWRRP
ncbi:S8 family serine peptidase [Streptomyces parvulus]|uniref:S8 family serine peptidase n=1 Tax=Streptomyces parvulus TaxID=146923 RepID=UPI003442A34B